METHDELALFEYLLKDEAFQKYRQKLEARQHSQKPRAMRRLRSRPRKA